MVDNSIKNAQETLKQLHGHICIFSRSIFKFQVKNETEISKITDLLNVSFSFSETFFYLYFR